MQYNVHKLKKMIDQNKEIINLIVWKSRKNNETETIPLKVYKTRFEIYADLDCDLLFSEYIRKLKEIQDKNGEPLHYSMIFTDADIMFQYF